MRILFCQPSSVKGSISGPEHQTVQIARALQERGHDVTVAALLLSPAKAEEVSLLAYAMAKGLRTAIFLAPARYNLADSVRRFREFVAQREPDIVCVAGYKMDIVTALCRRVPSIAWTPGWTGHDIKVRLFEWLDRKLLRYHDAVVVVSPQQRQEVLRHGVPEHKVFYLPTTIDASTLPAAYSSSQLRQMFCIREDASILGTVARLSLEKGHRFALEAARLLRERGTCYQWLMVGSGVERETLERLSTSLGLQDTVHFLGERADARSIIGGLDLMVLPSLTEGLPNVVLEAFAYRTPVVATAVGGVPELVKDGETGWLVPPRDPHALAKAIQEALSNPEEARRRAENAYRHLLANFTVEKQAEAWERALQAAIENWQKRR
ncbi:MAG: glycosyltransferase family 4 protein [Armatimonadota bacterium]|nr:glycosyltransferase family 4 protein [Armatimonadota bacterium]